MYKLALIIVIVLLIVIIAKEIICQKFSVYTSGATQRYASEFSSTNQLPSVINKLAFKEFGGNEPYTSAQTYENYQDLLRKDIIATRKGKTSLHSVNDKSFNDKSNVHNGNSKKSLKMEKELFAKSMSERGITLNM